MGPLSSPQISPTSPTRTHTPSALHTNNNTNMTLPVATKELLNEALGLVAGQISGLYPFEPFFLRGTFNILYQSSKQPHLFSSKVQHEALLLCDFLIASQLDLFYAHVFRALICMKYQQYPLAIESLYNASHQFIPRATLTYPFLTDYLTIFNALLESCPNKMAQRQFPLLTMTDIDGTAHKFSFDISKKRIDAYVLPLDQDTDSNPVLKGSVSPPPSQSQHQSTTTTTTTQTHATPAPGKTPAVRNNPHTTSTNDHTTTTSSLSTSTTTPSTAFHSTPQTKSNRNNPAQPMSSKVSQSVTKNASPHSSEHKPLNGRPDTIPSFALPEPDDEFAYDDYDDTGLFASNEAFYSTTKSSTNQQQQSTATKTSSSSSSSSSSHSTTSSSLNHSKTSYSTSNEFNEDELERVREELTALEKSKAKLTKNGFVYQLSAALGAISVASLWVLSSQYNILNPDWEREQVRATEEREVQANLVKQSEQQRKDITAQSKQDEAVYNTNRQRHVESRVRRKVPTGTEYKPDDDSGEVLMRPQRHRRRPQRATIEPTSS